MIGQGKLAAALTSVSSLNALKSSLAPPPRPMIRVSILAFLASFKAFKSDFGASLPWTRLGNILTSTRGFLE